MDRVEQKIAHRIKRKKRVRKKIHGSRQRPRVSVFKSNCHLYVQVIDDVARQTITSVGTIKKEQHARSVNVSVGKDVGKALGKKLNALKITAVVFDCNGNRYHGVLKALAECIHAEGVRI